MIKSSAERKNTSRDRLETFVHWLNKGVLFVLIFALSVCILDGLLMTIAHYAFGYSWAWANAHFFWRLFLASFLSLCWRVMP